MPQWVIHDQFARIPECEGKVALSIAFAQFIAVECDQDPFDQVTLAQHLAEATPPQQVMRWFARLLQSGQLTSFSRPLGGGPVATISPVHWQADDLVARFLTSQYSRTQPFDPSADPDSWIFLDADGLETLWAANRDAFLQATGQSPKAQQAKPSRAFQHSPKSIQAFGGHLLGLPEVEVMVGLKRSTIYKLVEQGQFPPQIKVGGRALWRMSAIEEWISKLGQA